MGTCSPCRWASSSRSSCTTGTSTARSLDRSSARTGSSRRITPRSTGAPSRERSASGDLARGGHRECRHGLVEALQLDVAERGRLDRILDRGVHAAAHEDLTGLRLVREALRLDDHHAHRAVVEPALEPDPAERGVAHGDPDPEAEVVAPLLPAGLELEELRP